MSPNSPSASSSSTNFELSTNLAQLPYGLFSQLARQLDTDELWRIVFNDSDKSSPYNLSTEETERYKRVPEQGVHLLRLLGNRAQTVKGFLARLHSLAKVFGPRMDIPQLLLHRRFCAVIWSRPEQVLVTVVGAESEEHLRLQCKASAFPTPRYQWLDEDRPLENADQSTLVIVRCPCTARNVFRCRVWNEVEEGQDWSEFYRAPGKPFQSELLSDVVDLKCFVPQQPNKNCEQCSREQMESLCRMLGPADEEEGTNQNGLDEVGDQMLTTVCTEELVAADKVALIVSNRTYAPQMGNLITPHCDAETLAECLQKLNFKTVTLGDLNLAEMKALIREYRKLLGEGVYAVFYFVGHGFEAHGQCYLLPIGAPGENYGPNDCLSMDWVMAQFRGVRPALNLILLDICRKFLPSSLDVFNKYAEQFQQGEVLVNRNTIYGYATSGGVGAYEVKGEINGVFMKYLKRRITQPLALLPMLNKVFRDVERDKKVCDVQIPELRSNLTQPRSLCDPLVFEGHTTSYDHHTFHWQTMHELPVPVYVDFPELELQVTIWFDFCGRFTNKVVVFSSVGDLPVVEENSKADECDGANGHAMASTTAIRGVQSARATQYLAYLRFPPEFECTAFKLCEDDEEGVSLSSLVSQLQKAKGELTCTVELRKAHNEDGKNVVVAVRKGQKLGHVLISKLGLANRM